MPDRATLNRDRSTVLPDADLSTGHVFILFYSVTLLADFDDSITRPIGWIVLATVILVMLRPTRVPFLCLLAGTTFVFLYKEIPDTENHTNALVFTNIGLILCLIVSWLRAERGNVAEFYDIAAPIARLSIIVILAAAGFNKLNYDFINPEVSCVRQFSGDISDVFRSDYLGVGLSPGATLTGGLVVCLWLLWRQRPNLAWPHVDWRALSTPLVAILLGAFGLIMLSGGFAQMSPAHYPLFVLAVAVLCWQLVEAPLLALPRFQWVALCFTLVVHFVLAVLRIVDFQALAIALLVAFIPAQVWEAWHRRAVVRLGPIPLHRARLFVLLNLIGAALVYADASAMWPIPRANTAWGILFVVGVVSCLWPIISDLFSQDRDWVWQGTPVLSGSTPRWLYVVPLCLLLFGLTSHFGLRTAGNLSMYSNLRTEAGVNNHILFGRDQLKFAGYQEDVVHILDIGDSAGFSKTLDRWGVLEGSLLPMVEFRKLLFTWREQGRVVPMEFSYKGVHHESTNIAEDPDWRVDKKDWDMKLQDFRVIESRDGPNACRW